MNAHDIKQTLHRNYGTGNGTAIAFEVAAGTGQFANRHIDAVVMELWPSRGLTLHAIEIKVTRHDFKREIADGSKAEEIAQHCDYMSICAPLGLIKVGELPSAWGLIEIDAKSKLVFTKRAVKTSAKALSRLFMAAMLRSTARAPEFTNTVKELAEAKRKQDETFWEKVAEEVKHQSGDGAKWKEFKDAIGDINYKADEELLKTVRLIVRSGADNYYQGLRATEKNLREAADRIKVAADDMGLAQLPKEKRKW